jgi:hypothetical protein
MSHKVALESLAGGGRSRVSPLAAPSFRLLGHDCREGGHHHPDHLSDAVEKIAMREPMGERKAHVSGAVIPFRPNKT